MTLEPNPDKDTPNRGHGAVKAAKTMMIGDWVHILEEQARFWNYMVSKLKVNVIFSTDIQCLK